MADTVIGKVSLTPRGAYDPAVQYEALDVVRYQGSGYIVRRPCKGVTPEDGETYMLAVERGETGELGPRGEQGIQGRPGPQGPAGTPGMPEEDVLAAIGAAVAEKANAILETAGPTAEVTVDIAAGGSLLHPVSEIKLAQEGEGTPSLENIRNISGWDSIALTYNGETVTQEFPETVYCGSYDWTKGELTVTHKLFQLAVADMNNTESAPGWKDLNGLSECVAPDHNGFLAGCLLNIGGRASANTTNDRSVMFLSTGTFAMSQSEWKAQYPDLVCQIVLPLLEPRTVPLAPHEFLALSGQNTLSSSCGNTTVTFQADLKEYIDKRLAELVQEAGNETV